MKQHMGLLAAAASGLFRNPPQKDLENHLDEDLGGLLVDGERACRNVLLGVLASLDKLEREKISQRMKAGLETRDREKLRNPRLAEVAPVDREAHAR